MRYIENMFNNLLDKLITSIQSLLSMGKINDYVKVEYKTTAGDCNNIYEAEMIKPIKLRDFIDLVLYDHHYGNHGEICNDFRNGHSLTYSNGNIDTNGFTEEELDKNIMVKSMCGNYGSMDYLILFVQDGEITYLQDEETKNSLF